MKTLHAVDLILGLSLGFVLICLHCHWLAIKKLKKYIEQIEQRLDEL